MSPDVQVAECVVLRLIDVSLADSQCDTLVTFTLNMGTAVPVAPEGESGGAC